MAVWTVIIALTFAVCQRRLPPGRYVRVAYEELARAPEATMRALSEIVGFSFDPTSIHEFRQRQHHAMAGNAMRQDDRPIVFEERWRTVLPAWVRRGAAALGAPVSSLLRRAPSPRSALAARAGCVDSLD